MPLCLPPGKKKGPKHTNSQSVEEENEELSHNHPTTGTDTTNHNRSRTTTILIGHSLFLVSIDWLIDFIIPLFCSITLFPANSLSGTCFIVIHCSCCILSFSASLSLSSNDGTPTRHRNETVVFLPLSSSFFVFVQYLLLWTSRKLSLSLTTCLFFHSFFCCCCCCSYSSSAVSVESAIIVRDGIAL